MRLTSLKSVVSVGLLFALLLTWAAPAFSLRQTGLEESESNRARLAERLRRAGNGGNFPKGTQISLAGLEEGIGSAPIKHEVIREFASQFLSGRLPSGSSAHLLEPNHIPHPQLSTHWIGVTTVAERLVGAGIGLAPASPQRREIVNRADLRAQAIQDQVARAHGLLLDHVNFETKGLTPGGLQAGATSGDLTGARTPTVSDVVEHTVAFVEGKPGSSSIQMEGPGVETFGRFPDEARALMVVTHIDPAREGAVLKEHGAASIEEFLDPELPADQLVRRVAELNGVSVGRMDVTILTGDESDMEALKALQETYLDLEIDRVEGGTVQPALAATFGVNDGRGRLFLRRSGMTEAVFNTIVAGLYSADGAISIFRVVSEEVKGGNDRRYVWREKVLTQLETLRGDLEAAAIRDGGKIFSSREVTQPAVGAYTFLTNGRTDRHLPFAVPGIRQADHISVAHALVFASNPEQAGAGFLWLSKDSYDRRASGLTSLHAGMEETQLGPFPSIPAFFEHLRQVQPERLEHIRQLLSKDGTAPFLAADQGPGSTWGRPADSDGRQGAYRAALQREGLSLSDDEMFFQLKRLLTEVLSPHYFSAILLDHPSLQYIRNQEKITGGSILTPQAAVLVRREGPWKKGDPLPSWYTSTQEPKYRLDPTTSAEAMRADGADAVKLLINWDKNDPIYNRYYVEEVYHPSARETVQTQMPHVVEIVTPDPAKEDPRPVATKVAHILDSIQGISAQPTLPDIWKLEAPGRVKGLMAQPEALKALLALPADSSADQIRDLLKGFPEPVQSEAVEFIGGVRSIVGVLNPSGRPALLLTAGVSGAEFEVQYALVTKFGGQEVEGPFAGHLAGRGVWRAQLRLSDAKTFAPLDPGNATWQQIKGQIRRRLEEESVLYSETKLAPITAQFARHLQIPAAGLEEAGLEWLKPALGPDWMEVVTGVREMAQVADKVAVLIQPELLGVGVAVGDIGTEVAFMEMEGNLHGAFGWLEQTKLRLGLLTPQSVEAYEGEGYRVIQVLRHPESGETPLPWQTVPLVVAEALAGGRPIFRVNVASYLNLKGITLPEILATLTDLFT